MIVKTTAINNFLLIQRIGFFFSNFNYKFEPKYMNLSVDLSIYKTNTKKHPVYLVPEAKIEIFEDIPKLHVISQRGVLVDFWFRSVAFQIQLFAKDLKTEKILANRTVDICDMNNFINNNVFFHSLMHHMMENLKFALKCPFKKVINRDGWFRLMTEIILQGVYVMKEHNMPNYVVPGMVNLKDKFLNVQKLKTKLDNHIHTVFESSYVTEVCEFNNWNVSSSAAQNLCNKIGERLNKLKLWKLIISPLKLPSASFVFHKFTIDSSGDLFAVGCKAHILHDL